MIDDHGEQPCYSGPFELSGLNYIDQDWFHEVARLGTYTSDVFLGFRNSPHFAIATKHDQDDGGFHVLRATVDADMLSEQILTAGLNPSDDVFLINRDGILQSPSRRYGEILQPFPMPVPHFSPSVEDAEIMDILGEKVFMSSAYIASSPFILIHVKPAHEAMGRWFTLRNELLGFLVLSAALILGVILWVPDSSSGGFESLTKAGGAISPHGVQQQTGLYRTAGLGRCARDQQSTRYRQRKGWSSSGSGYGDARSNTENGSSRLLIRFCVRFNAVRRSPIDCSDLRATWMFRPRPSISRACSKKF